MESDSIWIPWVHFLCSLPFILFFLLILFGVSCRYTSKMLLAAIDEQCRGTYDFIYLPIDFKASEFSGGSTLVYYGAQCTHAYEITYCFPVFKL
jgi:hypothetical protein